MFCTFTGIVVGSVGSGMEAWRVVLGFGSPTVASTAAAIAIVIANMLVVATGSKSITTGTSELLVTAITAVEIVVECFVVKHRTAATVGSQTAAGLMSYYCCLPFFLQY